MQVDKATARLSGHHDLVELLGDALTTDDLDTVGIALQSLEGLVVDIEFQLGRKADAAKHTQRIIRERDVGIERRADDAVLKIVEAIKRIDELAEAVFVEAHGKGVDGEVAPVES